MTLDQARRLQREKFLVQGSGISGFQLIEIDACELAKAEKHFLFKGLLRGDGFDLLGRKSVGRDGRHVLRGVMRVGPAGSAIERMRACAEAEIRFAAPVFK